MQGCKQEAWNLEEADLKADSLWEVVSRTKEKPKTWTGWICTRWQQQQQQQTQSRFKICVCPFLLIKHRETAEVWSCWQFYRTSLTLSQIKEIKKKRSCSSTSKTAAAFVRSHPGEKVWISVSVFQVKGQKGWEKGRNDSEEEKFTVCLQLQNTQRAKKYSSGATGLMATLFFLFL